VVVVDVGPPGAVVGTPGVVSGIGDSAPGSAAGEFDPIAAPGGAIDPTAVAPVETVPVVWAKAQAGVNAASRISGRIVMASLLDFPGSKRVATGQDAGRRASPCGNGPIRPLFAT
jgi:hypothetical protein